MILHSFNTRLCGMKTLTSFPKETPVSFPVKATRGGGSVTIYHKSILKGEVAYDQFLIPFKGDNGERRFHHFPAYERARAKGNEMLDLRESGQANAVTLTETDKVIYNRAQAAVRPIGVALDQAAIAYAHYWQRMGGDYYNEAVEQFIARRDTLKPITVPDLVKEFIAQKTVSTKRGRGASPDYVKDLQARLGRFAETFPGPIGSIAPDNVLTFLDGLKMSARTRFNYARLLRSLFRFGQSRRFLARDVDPMEGIDINFDDDGEVEIFTVPELTRLLSSARPELVPFLAIGAFAGLRHAEIKRLDWSEVHLDGAEPFIEIKAAKAKTQQRRRVPVLDNLKAWLVPHARQSGPVAQFQNCSKQLGWLVENINKASADTDIPKLVWKRNGLRHSFISYRVEDIQDVAQVALEAGNSPQMIFSNYRQLVRPADAKEWFSIMPTKQPHE